MRELIQFEELPAPGEPLEPKIHPDNKALLEAEQQRRIEMLSARLSWPERVRLIARYKLLKRRLSDYNALIKKRWSVFYEYQRMARLHAEKPSDAIRDRGHKLAELGRSLNDKISRLEPVAREYASITNRLKAHDDLIRYEREERENKKAFRREARAWESQIKAVFHQSPRLHHIYSDGKDKTKIVTPKIQTVLFREDRVLYHIQTTSQTIFERFLGKWHSALPYGVDVRDLVCDETLDNLSAVCKRIVTVERSKNGVNLFYCISRLDSSDGIPNKVPYGKMVEWYPAKDRQLMPFAAGVGQGRKTIWYNFEQYPHVLVAGSTKSGKSNYVNQMIATLITMHDTSELRLMLIDLKGGIEFVHWRDAQQLTGTIAKTPDMVLETLRSATELMRSRFALFETARAKNLLSYNQMGSEPLPRVVIVFDEMATLLNLGRLTTDIHTELRELASQGRAVGIHMVLCTQHPSVDVLPGWIKTNLGLRISGKMMTLGGSMTILDTGAAAHLPDVRGRLIFSDGHSEVIAQAPLISEAEIARAVEISRTYGTREAITMKPKTNVMTTETVIEYSIEQLDGNLSRMPIRDHFQVSEWAAREKLQAIIQQINDGYVPMYQGVEYRMIRRKHLYVLVPGGSPGENLPPRSTVVDSPVEIEVMS